MIFYVVLLIVFLFFTPAFLAAWQIGGGRRATGMAVYAGILFLTIGTRMLLVVLQ